MKRAILDQLLAARAKRQAVALVTNLADGSQRLVAQLDAAGDSLANVLADAFRFDQSGVHQNQFVHVHNPPLRLIMVGAVHIAQSIIPIAQLAGYDVIVIDPRGAFATVARFPGVTLHAEWPDETIPKLGFDARTAMIALTHDPKIDDPALSAAIKSKVFYIGALGSRKTHASRCERLSAKGATPEDLKRINGPIGLDIGAKGPAEIAISIMAQITRALRLGA
jgi:xanthine dehydrogenase accessory factor